MATIGQLKFIRSYDQLPPFSLISISSFVLILAFFLQLKSFSLYFIWWFLVVFLCEFLIILTESNFYLRFSVVNFNLFISSFSFAIYLVLLLLLQNVV